MDRWKPNARAIQFGVLLASLTLGCREHRDGGSSHVAAASSHALTQDVAIATILAERVEIRDPRQCSIGTLVPDLAFTDVAGNAGTLAGSLQGDALVLVLRDTGCPLCQRYGPRIAELEREYAARGVSFLFVNVAQADSTADMATEIEQFGFQGRYALDTSGAIGAAVGAQSTADVFVLDAKRTLVYRGAIDDQYGRGFAQAAPQVEYLREALDSVLARHRVVIAATTAPGCAIERAAAAPAATAEPAEPVTYHAQIARLVQRYCVDCHHEDGVAPFALDTYAAVTARKRMITRVLEQGSMPPWRAAPGSGPWANDLSMTDEDHRTLLEWIDAGCEEGDPSSSPVPYEWRPGWTIGEPDLVFELPDPFEVPAQGVVPYVRLAAREKVAAGAWVQAVQILPSAPKVVHHTLVTARPPARIDTWLERTAHRLVPWSDSNEPMPAFFAGYLPGGTPEVFPPGIARWLEPGTTIAFDMHYTPNGTAIRDRTRVGMIFAKMPPRFVVQDDALIHRGVFLPAGASNVVFTAERKISHDIVLRSLTPHMHLRGRAFTAELIDPEGRREKLLEIPDWDPAWQYEYSLLNPRTIRGGSRILITGTFDNSAGNLRNPDPGQEVHNGPQIWDEMLMCVIERLEPVPTKT